MTAATVTALVAPSGGTSMKASDIDRLLAAALPFAGRDRTMPILNGVRLQRTAEHLIVTATDRYVAFRERVKAEAAGDEWSFVLRAQDARTLRTMIAAAEPVRRRRYLLSVDLDASGSDELVARVGHLTATFTAAQGTYPNVDSLLDKSAAAAADRIFDVVLDPMLLARVASAGGSSWRFRQEAEFRPIAAVAMDHGRDAVVLLMPKRSDQ